MKIIKGGITAPRGFLAGAVNCGIKKSGRNDLALLFSEVPCVSAACFTKNKFKSGSVLVSKSRVHRGFSQAVIVNSGNANCCIGEKEVKDAEKITELLAKTLSLEKDTILIASTGVIGKPLPVRKIAMAIKRLVKDLKKTNSARFAKAIMTTDTVHKEIAVKLRIGQRIITLGGVAKGAGMISPDMATMLAFFTTDALIEKRALDSAFKEAVIDSFNKITVDGDMSTNDTAIILSNGLAGNRTIKKDESNYYKFLNALKFITRQLAKKIVLDGEGATKFVRILVKGAKDVKQAETIARAVATSNLVKTMIAGGDPNLGRIAAKIGSSSVPFKRDRVCIYFAKRRVMKDGKFSGVSKGILQDIFKKKEIHITIDLGSGICSAEIWTCDLTEGYVKINAAYETAYETKIN